MPAWSRLTSLSIVQMPQSCTPQSAMIYEVVCLVEEKTPGLQRRMSPPPKKSGRCQVSGLGKQEAKSRKPRSRDLRYLATRLSGEAPSLVARCFQLFDIGCCHGHLAQPAHVRTLIPKLISADSQHAYAPSDMTRSFPVFTTSMNIPQTRIQPLG